MDDYKIAVIQASLGGFDKPIEHIPQNISYDYFFFNDENFPPRQKAMTARLQAKIPKMFGWQLKPNYDYYIWLDGNIRMTNFNCLTLLLPKNEFTVLKHPKRPDIRQEQRYLRKGLREQSRYLVERYDNEQYIEQIAEITADKNFKDETLYAGGIFAYKPTDKVKEMLKDWWYFVSRYTVFDQFALPYVLKKHKIEYTVLEEDYNNTKYFELRGRNFHAR